MLVHVIHGVFLAKWNSSGLLIWSTHENQCCQFNTAEAAHPKEWLCTKTFYSGKWTKSRINARFQQKPAQWQQYQCFAWSCFRLYKIKCRSLKPTDHYLSSVFTQPAVALCPRDGTWSHSIDSHSTGPPLHSQVLGHGIWVQERQHGDIRFAF